MGYANAQRSLDCIETLAEFVSRPEVAEVRLTLLHSKLELFCTRKLTNDWRESGDAGRQDV
jgi:hypothetical protein